MIESRELFHDYFTLERKKEKVIKKFRVVTLREVLDLNSKKGLDGRRICCNILRNSFALGTKKGSCFWLNRPLKEVAKDWLGKVANENI